MNYYRLPWLAAALLLAALGLLPGLWGPLLLDDYSNLDRLILWLEDRLRWQGVVFGNESGPLGRPLSMATFLANGALFGFNEWWFKATNLLVHLSCGVLVAGFTHRLASLDERFRVHAGWISLLIAFWWLILPINTATVFYVIQRMAQLSALFIFAGLWLYLAGRERLESGQKRGAWMLLAGIPVLTLAGALAKENALLLPLLCGALELGMYPGTRRPGAVKWFLGLVVGVPILWAVSMVVWNPGYLLGGFERRDFTLLERLLTQGRVLWGYVQNIVIPAGSGLSLFQDNVAHSTGLLRPLTTLGAIIAWGAALAGAWFVRRSAPLILTGLLLFLGGHLMESSVFALELAFLHRNYMPSVGILIAVVGIASLVVRHLPSPSREFRRVGLVVLVLAGVVLWSATFARAWVWQSQQSLAAHEIERNPNSVRGRLMAAELAIRARETDLALHHIDKAEPHLPDRERGAASIWRMAAFCGSGRPVPEALIREFRQRADDYVSPFERKGFDTLTNQLERETCPLDNLSSIAQAGELWLDRSTQPGRATDVWRFRYNTARLLARSGEIETAFPHATRAFEHSGHEFPVGVFAFQLATSLERLPPAKRILDQLKAVENPNDLRHRRTIEQFEAYLESRESE